MTTLQLNLPDELAQDVQKFGTLESAEFIKLLESLTSKFKKQTTDTTTTPVTSILDRLSAPQLEEQGLSDIEFDIPKANISLKEVAF